MCVHSCVHCAYSHRALCIQFAVADMLLKGEGTTVDEAAAFEYYNVVFWAVRFSSFAHLYPEFAMPDSVCVCRR
jgi:hypothetical protein